MPRAEHAVELLLDPHKSANFLRKTLDRSVMVFTLSVIRICVRDSTTIHLLMAEILPLSKAIEVLVHDGHHVALEGFTHLIPQATGERLGLGTKGPTAAITDLGVLTPEEDSKELTLTSLHPGVTLEQVRAATAWELKISDKLQLTPSPNPEELRVLRDLGSAHRAGP
jgi:hypothetical protein